MKEATTKGTKSTKNCNSKGNSLRASISVAKLSSPLRKGSAIVGWIRARCPFVPFVCFVVASSSNP